MLIKINSKIMFIKYEDENSNIHLKRCLYLSKNYNNELTFEENILESKRYIAKEIYKSII